MKRLMTALVFSVSVMFSIHTQAAVISGTVNDAPESASFYFGDGVNDLQVFWSTFSLAGGNGWIYGSDFDLDSNVDFHIVAGGIAIETVEDASAFEYVTGSLNFNVDDTIFFRGLNGFFGALQIDNVYPNPLGAEFPYTFLDATWYFQTDGSASFAPVPLPAAVWLLLSGLGAVFASSRIRR